MKLEYLKEQLTYNPETGHFHWNVSRVGVKAGKRAGHKSPDGYWILKINREQYPAHRVAWFYMTGEWPVLELDHINRIKDDNRWSNLRQVTREQNALNINLSPRNTSGTRGIVWNSKFSKWAVDFRLYGERYFLGYFSDLEEAKKVRKTKLAALSPQTKQEEK